MILIDALILATITFVLGYIAGRVHTVLLLVKRVNKEIESLENELHQAQEIVYDDETAKCFVEERDGVYYLYETNTEMYLAQAKTLEELAQKIQNNNKIQYALVTLLHNEKEHEEFWFHEGEVNKL